MKTKKIPYKEEKAIYKGRDVTRICKLIVEPIISLNGYPRVRTYAEVSESENISMEELHILVYEFSLLPTRTALLNKCIESLIDFSGDVVKNAYIEQLSIIRELRDSIFEKVKDGKSGTNSDLMALLRMEMETKKRIVGDSSDEEVYERVLRRIFEPEKS